MECRKGFNNKDQSLCKERTMNKDFNLEKQRRSSSREGILKVLSTGNSLVQDVELWLLNEKKNRNKWTYKNLEEHLNLFENIPILVAFVDGKIGEKSGHNFRQVRKKDGSVVASFLDADAEHIVGRITSKDNVRIEQKDGISWIVAKGQLWTWYAQELVEHLQEQGLDGQQISIETLVKETTYDEENDEVFTKWLPIGVSIIGVQEAVEGAYIKTLSALDIDEIREKTLRVASMYQEQTNKNPQTKTNKEKQTIMNKKSLKDNFKGFNVIEVVGDKVALLSCDKHEAYVSSAVKDNGEIVEGVKTAVNATVVFGEGENEVKATLDSVIETFKTENDELKDKIADKDKTIKALSETNEKMKTQETERRKEAVKTAIDNRFAEIKANSDADFADNECDELKSDEKVNEFIAMEDKDEKFIGDTEAVKAVDACCMNKIIESHKVRANSQKKAYAWDNPVGGGQTQHKDNVDAMIDKYSGNE